MPPTTRSMNAAQASEAGPSDSTSTSNPAPRARRPSSEFYEVEVGHGLPANEVVWDYPYRAPYRERPSGTLRDVYLITIHISQAPHVPFVRILRPAYTSMKDAKAAAWLFFCQQFPDEELEMPVSFWNIEPAGVYSGFYEEGWLYEETSSICASLRCGSKVVVRIIEVRLVEIAATKDEIEAWGHGFHLDAE